MALSKQGGGVRQLTWLLAWAVVFCDIGTSVYYVPGILYDREGIGSLAPFFIILTAVGFVLLALKYVEIVERTPEGGGVVAIGHMAFGERIGALGGMFITVDFFLTCAISSVAAFHYLASANDALAGGSAAAFFSHVSANVPLYAIAGLLLLGAVNTIGLRESATLSLGMAAASLLTNLVVVAVTAYELGGDAERWRALAAAVFGGVGELGRREMLIGFGAAWLAFSGLESMSQLAPVIREPLRRTARMTMASVVVTILLTSPTLAVLSVGVLPAAGGEVASERLISQLAFTQGGSLLGLAVVVTASSLLLFAANTAIIGAYHVFVALSERRYFPNRMRRRHERFNTPYLAIRLATVVPIAIIWATGGELGLLGDMYAFGLLGAFIIESGGLDRIRWREGQRGLGFWFGVLPTVMVITAWIVNMVEKPTATLFGGTLAAVGMLIGTGLRRGWIKDAFHTLPMVAKRDMAKIGVGERVASEEIHDIITLAEAREVAPFVKSSTLVAVSGTNDDVVAEGIRRARGMGESALYCLFVEEWPGLFPSEEGVLPSQGGIQALTRAAVQAAEAGVELVPIWTASHNAALGIAHAVEELSVAGVMIGSPTRSAMDRLLRGQVVRRLQRMLPEQCRLVICD